jgi:GT2 family glycosyltransferase
LSTREVITATGHAVRSFGATAAALLGGIVSALRLLPRLWGTRVHAMRLEPLQQLAVEGDGFRSLGDDPQFLLTSSRRRLPRWWVVVSFVVEPHGQWLSPKLYVDCGDGFSEESSRVLPVRAGRRVECTLRLPDRVRALRLDPLETSGPFVLKNVEVREIGVAQLVVSLLHLLRTVSAQWRDLARLANLALTTLRRGGLREVAESLLAREREASEYQDWINAYDTLKAGDERLIRRHVARLHYRPVISILMPTHNTREPLLRRAIESLRAQLYPDWELCIADDASSLPHVRRVLAEYRSLDPRIKVVYRAERGDVAVAANSALALASGEFTAVLDHDDALAARALYLVAVELNADPALEIIYSDEDQLGPYGQRIDPYLKPDWNPDLFVAQNFLTHLCVCRTERVREVAGFRRFYEGAQDWDLMLRIAERVTAAQIRHIPQILYHRQAAPGAAAAASGERAAASAAQHRALTTHFDRAHVAVEILPIAGRGWRVRYPLPQPAPLVTVIIPTRDRVSLLRRCIASLRQRTTYSNLHIVIVDNQSVEWSTRAYLSELARASGVTVIRHEAAFNYSALNNVGARHARGEILALLNNDVESITPDWLAEMVSQACRPDIGAVGAMLYYPNDTIQHAGVILGHGTAGIAAHAYAHRRRGYAGQFGRARLTQNVTAVTAACLVVRRQVFEEVGGFDETHLAIGYSDLDFCLRIRERGYRNLWTPYAELYHRESASRGYEDTSAKRERFQREVAYIRERWGAALRSDPAYNPNLSLDAESFTLAFPPRTVKPWLDAEETEPAPALRAHA